MRSLLAVALCAALFVSTIDAQTFAPAQTLPAQAAVNLNGLWEIADKDNAGNRLVNHFLIATASPGFTMCVTQDQKTCLPHTTLAGSFGVDRSALRLVTTFNSKEPVTYLTVLDPDHLKGPRGVYVRSAPGAYDVPCDAKNSWHVAGDFGTLRARDAIHHYKSDALTACWMRIAAEGGNARAQGFMAYFAHEGEGVPKDLYEAQGWAQKSADQEDALGQIMLGLMYENHEIAFFNPLGTPGVIDKAYEQLNRIRHEQGLPPIQQRNQQQTAQGPDPKAVGAAALGILLMGAMAGISGSSSGSSGNEAWRGEYDRQQQINRENQSGCANGDSGACNRAGESMPEPQ